MSIFIALIVLLLLAQLALRFSGDFYGPMEFLGVMGTVISGVLLLLCLVSLPINRIGVRAEIAAFNAVRDSRSAGVPEIEAAAWRMKVAEQNAWLASTQFYNSTVFDLWIPDVIDSLQPIQ